jgi:hypothetical protein
MEHYQNSETQNRSNDTRANIKFILAILDELKEAFKEKEKRANGNSLGSSKTK